jgi:hypothetical protein
MNSLIRHVSILPFLLAAVAELAPARATDLVISTYAGNDVVTVPFPAGSPLATLVTAGSGGLTQPNALTYGPDGYIYAASTVTNSVLRYYPDGSYDPYFVWPTILGFAGPADVLFDPADGTLLVSGINSGQIIRLNVTTGAWSNVITPYTDGLGRPGYMCFHPVTGRLLVADYQNHTVLELCNSGSVELCTFITAGLGGLNGPENMIWRANELYVVSYGGNQVLRYDAAGAFIDVVAPTGAEVPAASAFHGLAFGPDSKLYTGDRTNGRVLKYTVTPTVVNSSVFGGVFATGMDTADLKFHTTKRAEFPLVKGEVVATFCPDLVGGSVPNPNGFCVKVVDPRGNGPLGRNWLAPMFSNEDATNPANVWNHANLGPVFGCCLDHKGNIFVAATGAYGNFPLSEYPAGPGAVYKIDRLTGAISVWLGTLAIPSVLTALAPGLTSLPNTGPGLGDICYDPYYDQFFVTNLEDGKIYRVKDTPLGGVVQNAYDPFGNDDTTDGTPGFPALGERVYAVHKLNARILLWSAWLRDSGPGGRQSTPWPTATWPALPSGQSPNNAVFMSFTVPNNFGGTALVKVMPWLSATVQYSNPVTDITDNEASLGGFMNASRILFAERTYVGDYGIINSGGSAHHSRVLEYIESLGFPASLTHFHVGSYAGVLPTPTNAAGGIAYDSDDNVWATGDALINAVNMRLYGLQRIPSTGNDFSPEIAQSYLIDLDHKTEYYDKSQCGDVEFVEHTTWYWRRFNVTCAGDMYSLNTCGAVALPDHGSPNSVNPDGALLVGNGEPNVSADTAVLQASGLPNGPILFFQGTAPVNWIQGIPFGDGLLGVGGSIVRMGVTFAVGGAAQIPSGSQPSLSTLGLVPGSGGVRYYQGWYRDSSPGFCTSAVFNLTNAIAAEWTP